MCNREDSVDLTRRPSSQSVVGARVGFVSALPGEDCEHTGKHRWGGGRKGLGEMI